MWATLAAPAVAGQEPQATRTEPRFLPYEQGPLTWEHFQGPVPEVRPRTGGLRSLAYTDTDIRFDARYEAKTAARETTISLTDVRVRAVFLIDRSWSVRKTDRTLLDHEQGHFDVTQIHALQLELALLKGIREGKPLTGRGRRGDEAIADLRKQLLAVIGAGSDRAAAAQKDYDLLTRQGTAGLKQREQRGRQRQLLREIAAEITDIREALNGDKPP